jgi:hypothetical protein
MPNGLTPQVVDIPMLLPNQTPGKHAGPLGRLTSMLNAQIRHFLPSSQAAPQKIVVEPRDGFTALTAECRDVATGAIVTGDWLNPELLAPIDNQLLSVCDSIPRVNNGASWTYYGNNRLVANQLSEDVLHTTNRTIAVPDSAYLAGVTCSVWTEQFVNPGPQLPQQITYVGFRGDDGAWIRTPTQLFDAGPQNPATPVNPLARVVQDGTRFWVFFNTTTTIQVQTYDTHGALITSLGSPPPLRWTNTPGYWDIAAFNNAGTHYTALIQPHALTTTGADVGLDLWTFTEIGTGTINVTTSTVAGVHCSGPCAFSANDVSTVPFIVTEGDALAHHLFSYELSHAIIVQHEYDFGAVLPGFTSIPDSLTGWTEANGAGIIAHVAYSLLSNFSPPAGPANDPGLRYVRSYACTRAGAVTLTTQANNVLLQSRAFRVDNDWYAATYYQGGAGNVSAPGVQTIVTDDSADYFTGAASQPIATAANDFTTGGPVDLSQLSPFGLIAPTQFIPTITHNAGDSAAAATRTWTLLNATFTNNPTVGNSSAQGGILHIVGDANPANNGDWYIQSVPGPTTVVTDGVSLQGTGMVDSTLAGVTATLTQGWPVYIPLPPAWPTTDDTPYPDANMMQRFLGGTVVIAGAGGAAVAVNGTYTVAKIYASSQWRSAGGTYATSNIFILLKTSGAAGSPTTTYSAASAGMSMTLTPLIANAWALIGNRTSTGQNLQERAGVETSLMVTGAHQGGNNGTFPITAISSGYNKTLVITGSQSAQRAELFLGFGASLPTVIRTLDDPSQAFVWHLTHVTFDPSYVGAILVMGFSTAPEDDGVFQITSVVDAHTVIAQPIDGKTGQTLYNMNSGEVITITRSSASGTPAYQPCWFLTPLSVAQHVAGRWEWAIAFADWRFDGNPRANTATFERNAFPLALTSVVPGPAGKQLTLPYRAQSFTAGQTVQNSSGSVVGIQSTAESTVGLKLFTLATAPGQAMSNAGEMLIPGAMAAQFSASGFTEDNINLGPEKPFVVSQTTDPVIAVGLTLGTTYQYIAVFEVTSESGDRVWSVTSPPLDVTLQGTQNTVTLGGRMPGPTNRVVGVALYRTAHTGSPPIATIQHYKITNDLDVNGRGFTFTSVNGGAAFDTWQFIDQVPDSTVLSAEPVYTDKRLLQRFPAPAFRQGVANWEARSWVIGYDGAIWMSGEKAEGDAIWYHPAFRYTAFGDDTPVAVASMDNYLVVFCERSIWVIPAAQFPDATGSNGSLPTPVPLPFRNGCTGFVQTVKAGVAYSSTAGGVWLINRSLQNIWLSEPLQDDLKLGITGMSMDGLQRLVVMTGSGNVYVFDEISQGWFHWTVASGAASLVTTWQGNATIQDAARVRAQAPGTFADITDGVAAGVAPDVTMTLAIGPVKGQKCVWAINLTGEFLGHIQLFVTLSYPDDPDEPPTSYGPYDIFGGGGVPMNIEINPMVESATTFDLHVQAAFAGVAVPGASYSLELITAEVGIDQTMSKRPNSQRLPGT